MQERIDLLTIEEMASRLKVHQSWLYRRVKETGPDAIPRIKVGKYLRFREADVMDWITKRNEPQEAR